MTIFQYFDTTHKALLYWNNRIYVDRPDLNGVDELGDGYKRFISRTWYE